MSVFWQVMLILGCVGVVVGVVVSRIIAWKKGKAHCDCGCADCAACKYCKGKKEE